MQKNSDSRTTPIAWPGLVANQEHFARSVLDKLADAFHATSILVTTPEGTVIFANGVAATGLSGHTSESVVGLNLLDITPKVWAEERIRHMQLAIEREHPITIIEIIAGTRLSSTISPFRPKLQDGTDGTDWMLLVTVERVTPTKLQWLRDHNDTVDLVNAEVIDLGPLSALSPRELEVIALMGQGLRQKQIAERLHRSVSTIDRHRERIGEKLGITDRIELVAMAREAALELEDAQRTHVTFQDFPTKN